MSSASPRRQVLVLAGIAVLVVALFAVGVLGGGRGDDGDGGWGDRLAGLAPVGALEREDLTPVSDCRVAADGGLSFSGSCRFEVAGRSAFSFASPTRRGTLQAAAGPLTVQVTVQGTDVETDLDPGDTVDLTYGTDGGALTLRCRRVQPCLVTLGTESST